MIRVSRVREICGIVLGGIATLVAGLTVILVVLAGRLIVSLVKLFCLPLVILASVIYPDERNLTLLERIAEDIRAWWQTLEPAF